MPMELFGFAKRPSVMLYNAAMHAAVTALSHVFKLVGEGSFSVTMLPIARFSMPPDGLVRGDTSLMPGWM